MAMCMTGLNQMKMALVLWPKSFQASYNFFLSVFRLLIYACSRVLGWISHSDVVWATSSGLKCVLIFASLS